MGAHPGMFDVPVLVPTCQYLPASVTHCSFDERHRCCAAGMGVGMSCAAVGALSTTQELWLPSVVVSCCCHIARLAGALCDRFASGSLAWAHALGGARMPVTAQPCAVIVHPGIQ